MNKKTFFFIMISCTLLYTQTFHPAAKEVRPLAYRHKFLDFFLVSSIEATNPTAEAPLDNSIALPLVKHLLSLRASPNATVGRSAVIAAISAGNSSILELLFTCGASTSSDIYGTNPRGFAEATKQRDCLECIEKHKNGTNPAIATNQQACTERIETHKNYVLYG